jgi:ATP-dependent Lhr-like helicase
VSLSGFHPLISRWFSARVGEPTKAQRLAWPHIAAGEHVLVTAPTGSGKTLTAFLWSLNQLFTGGWTGVGVQVLYVSPLRALNNDIRRNLIGPLTELEAEFRSRDEPVQKVRVATRSGDTPSTERQRMIRNPPEILITTPESLNILLTSKGGRAILGSLRCVILDEIHAVAGSKRGTHLMTAVERLTLLSGEFQRIALSATVKPIGETARFVGGQELMASPPGGEPVYRRRPVEVVATDSAKRYQLEIDSKMIPKQEGAEHSPPVSIWEPVVEDLRQRIQGNRSTLLFANSRRVTEKVTRLLNQNQGSDLAYSHHGSLSREIRGVVEKRLKEGRLAAIVATSSLELGIDIGALDEVILLRTPPSVAAAVQRLGRAGHGVGQVSRGRFYPLFENDLLESVAVAQGVEEQDIEEIRPVLAPLDVLAQVVLSMVAVEPWRVEDLYRFIRTAHAYRKLPRDQFDLVLEMLAGRYSDSRIRELKPRVSLDRVSDTVRARPGAARLIYTSGGTIPDRGYFHLRLAQDKAKLGELDEEFVWERSVGDTFTLGAQSWQIKAITHNDVLVQPAHRGSAMAPFWRAEERNRSFHLSERIGLLLTRAEQVLSMDGGPERLRQELETRGVATKAAEDLTGFLVEQRAVTGQPLPHRYHLLVENLPAQDEQVIGQRRVILHTRWGGRVNRPLALALAAAWKRETNEQLQIEQDNDCLMLSIPAGDDPMRILRLVHPDNLERLLREELEQSGFFGARFRENAGRALLLPRGDFRRRVPLWFNRQRAKKLLQSIQKYEDFPVLVETWRTCLQDEFDLDNLARVLAELEGGEILSSETTTSTPSPFAADVVWKLTNRLMYEDDQPETAGRSPLRHDLLRELVFGSQLRPRLPDALVADFQRKLHRTYPGYAPQSSDDLIDWVRERVVMPLSEWQELLAAMERDLSVEAEELEALLQEAYSRLVRVAVGGNSKSTAIAHVEQVPRLMRALDILPVDEGSAIPLPEEESAEDPDPLVGLVTEWIRFYGPFDKALLSMHLGIDETHLEAALETLADEEIVVIDHFREGLTERDELEICDTENLERLLRLLRAASRPSFQARPVEQLPHLLAHQQGLGRGAGDAQGLRTALEDLFGYPAPVGRWESEILPARMDPYYTNWLDGLFQETDLIWLGCGKEQISFVLRSDRDLLQESPDQTGNLPASLSEIFPSQPGRYSLTELLARSGLSSAELSARLWELAWQGAITNTTFRVLRRGVLNRFEPPNLRPPAGSAGRTGSGRRGLSRRGRFERWRAGRPDEGDWWVPSSDPLDGKEPLDALDLEELNKDRVRLLLQRHGVLFRELLARELPVLQWSRLFRTLRLMELSGEILSGRFFEGVPGVQFISPSAFRDLREGLPDDAIYWMNATDPASPCGLALEGLKGRLPARRTSNHLVYHGNRNVVVSQRGGAELEIRVSPEHPKLSDYLDFLGLMLTRQFAPKKAITVELINNEPATSSPYAPVLESRFATTREPSGLKLRRRF